MLPNYVTEYLNLEDLESLLLEKVRGLFGTPLSSYEEGANLAPTFFKDILFLKEIKGEEKSNPLVDYVKHHYPSSLFAIYDKANTFYFEHTRPTINIPNLRRSNPEPYIPFKVWDTSLKWEITFENGLEGAYYYNCLTSLEDRNRPLPKNNVHLPKTTTGSIILPHIGLRNTSDISILVLENKINFLLPNREEDILLLMKHLLEQPCVFCP